jgi:hypothetical protein
MNNLLLDITRQTSTINKMKKLNKKDYQFVQKVAKDSVNMTLNVEELREAYKLIKEQEQPDLVNMKVIRKMLYDFNEEDEKNGRKQVKPKYNPLTDPDFDINKELPIK